MAESHAANESILTINEVAEKFRVHPRTVREAIHKGELKAFIPRGREPLKAGPGMGYRIKSADAHKWYFGE